MKNVIASVRLRHRVHFEELINRRKRGQCEELGLVYPISLEKKSSNPTTELIAAVTTDDGEVIIHIKLELCLCILNCVSHKWNRSMQRFRDDGGGFANLSSQTN